MKESSFITKNKDSWREYEGNISNKNEKPHKLSRLFIKLTDDLSYSYTYYKNRSVRIYLNGLAKLLFNRIYNSENIRLSNLKKYFNESVPLAIYQARKEFYISFIIFTISMIIGMISSKYDPDFARLILGDDYINMTNANIAKNDPMAVYKSQAPFDMFFAITLNNTLVAIRTFVLGFFMAIGTIFIMIYNGIMVGSFQYFFIEQGLFKESFLTIWQHGVLEISSIIIAGAAGLVLGKGIVFPGNFTRSQSLRISARKGLKLLIGILPILLIAAFIEGFYTRYTDAPDLLRIITILLSLAFIVGYFVLLPIRRNKQSKITLEIDNKIESTSNTDFNTKEIYSGSELFMSTFQVLKSNFSRILKFSFLTSLIISVLILIIDQLNLIDLNLGFINLKPIDVILTNRFGYYLLLVSFTVHLLLLSRIKIQKPIKDASTKTNPFVFTLQIIVIYAIVLLPLLIPNRFFAILFFLILFMFSSLIIKIMIVEKLHFLTSTSRTFKYLKYNFWKFVFLSFKFVLLGILFYAALTFAFSYLNEFLQMNLYGTEETKNLINLSINIYYFCFVIFFISSFIYLGNSILYYSIFESYHAKNLLHRINLIGKVKRIRGLLRE